MHMLPIAIVFLATVLAMSLDLVAIHWVVLAALVTMATWLYAIRGQRPTPRFWFLLVAWTLAAIACAAAPLFPPVAIVATAILVIVHTGIHYTKPWAWWIARVLIWTVCTGFTVWAIVITADRLTPLPTSYDALTDTALKLAPLFIGAAYFSSAAIVAWQTFSPAERQRIAETGASPYWKSPDDIRVTETAEPQS